MSFGFDPSIILSGTKAAAPSLNETLQTMAQIASQTAQQQHAQATLADLVRRQGQEQTLADILRRNAPATGGGVSADLMRAGLGQQAMAWQDQEAQMEAKKAADRKARLELETAYRRHIGERAQSVKDQASSDAFRQELLTSGDPFLAHYAQATVPEKYTPEGFKPIAEQAISPEKRATIEAMSGRGPIVIGEDGTMMRATGTIATPLTDAKGNPIKARPKGGGGGGAGGAFGGLTEAALEQQVDAYHGSGKIDLPGRGKSAEILRLRIMNRAAEKYPSGDIALSKADYKANTEALQAMQKQAAFVDQFENTAEKNLDLFIERATKSLVDTGSPFLNMPIREAAVKFKGDPELAAINALRQTAISEVSKVLSGNTGSGGATEGVRNEAKELIREDATVGQSIATAKALKQDMANRKSSVAQAIKDVRDRISGKPAKGSAPGGGLSPSEAEELKRLEKQFGGST